AGADFVASKIEAIASNPKVWRKTAFILNYDENDGLFDHVPPPTPAAGTPDEFVQGLPIGGGFRVPAIIVSPWTVGGWVASEAFDHTSALQFLERFTGVEEPNVSDWRRSTFGDFTSAFRFSHGRPRPPRLPDDTAEQLEKAKEEVATLPKPTLPGADQSFPRQEKGHRPHV
ncbi:alkaline phosphatase family protein, partial [Streptomyces mirabilis]